MRELFEEEGYSVEMRESHHPESVINVTLTWAVDADLSTAWSQTRDLVKAQAVRVPQPQHLATSAAAADAAAGATAAVDASTQAHVADADSNDGSLHLAAAAVPAAPTAPAAAAGSVTHAQLADDMAQAVHVLQAQDAAVRVASIARAAGKTLYYYDSKVADDMAAAQAAHMLQAQQPAAPAAVATAAAAPTAGQAYLADSDSDDEYVFEPFT